MNVIDAAIKFLKGELVLSEEGKADLLYKLYNYRFTQSIYYRGAHLTCCVGDNEPGWLMINQHFIQKGEVVKFNGRDHVVTEIIVKQFEIQNVKNGIVVRLEYINGQPC